MTVPLTTTFSPPSRCTTELWWIAYDPNHFFTLLGGQGYSSCLPASFTPTSDFFYSPGLYCPNGYQSACTSSQVVGDETATIVTCCPTEYSCQNSDLTSGWPWEYTLGCTSACSSEYSMTLRDSSGTIISTCFSGGGLNAYSVQLRFRAADLVTTTSTAESSTPSSSSPLPSSTPNSSSPLPSSTPTSGTPTNTDAASSSNDTGLSTGAKAGIGVGAVLGVALIGAILYLAWSIRRNSRNNSPSGGFDQSELVQQPPILYDPKAPDSRMSMGSHLPYEQNRAQFQRHELPAPR